MFDFMPIFLDSLPMLFDPTIALLILAGYLVGMIVGALPGLGPTLAFGLVLPFTFLMEPIGAVAFLLSISAAAMYSNSVPAILMGVPGSTAAVMTAIDGYALHRQGKSGLALAVQFVAAAIGQLISIFFFLLLVIPLARLAYYFLAPELFAVFMVGMVAVVSLTGRNLSKGFIAAGIGLAIGVIGFDPVGTTVRLDYGIYALRQGIPVAPALIGLLALSELIRQSRQAFGWKDSAVEFDMKFPKYSALKRLWYPIMSGTVVGTLVGALPGAGGTPAALIAYQQAQIASKTPEEFGNGSIEGIAANEAAQNASNSGELIPTIGFGLPGSGSMALLLGALAAQGFAPGPRFISNNPQLVSGLVAGLLGGTILMVITGWYMSKALLKLVLLNRSAVIILAMGITIVGVYSLQARLFDVVVCIICGIVGYLMLRYGYPPAAAALTAVLSSDIEKNFRVGLNLTRGSYLAFVTRPYTAMILGVALLLAFWGIRGQVKLSRQARTKVAA
jgi:putative tricarboxylic transport membrane protein